MTLAAGASHLGPTSFLQSWGWPGPAVFAFGFSHPGLFLSARGFVCPGFLLPVFSSIRFETTEVLSVTMYCHLDPSLPARSPACLGPVLSAGQFSQLAPLLPLRQPAQLNSAPLALGIVWMGSILLALDRTDVRSTLLVFDKGFLGLMLPATCCAHPGAPLPPRSFA